MGSYHCTWCGIFCGRRAQLGQHLRVCGVRLRRISFNSGRRQARIDFDRLLAEQAANHTASLQGLSSWLAVCHAANVRKLEAEKALLEDKLVKLQDEVQHDLVYRAYLNSFDESQPSELVDLPSE